FFMLLDLRRSRSLMKIRVWTGFFLGLGGFQLFDGIIDHKVLRTHQIRYVENILPYDIAWNLAGLILLLIGIYLSRRARSIESSSTAATSKKHRL
ncbi:MAG: DUF2243 domain-containing protein, partial [Bacteroidetes bacterium]|nr:DUF2243 domain-containing protein [Bacteroidota bacterium]